MPSIEFVELSRPTPDTAEWIRPDFEEFATPPEVTAYAGER